MFLYDPKTLPIDESGLPVEGLCSMAVYHIHVAATAADANRCHILRPDTICVVR
ncbi:hypothetical protein [Bifidobacterium breve]|uniref:hypothetical protein n=1 Tax=Bifidobacterium breve TaxID=1685 RepID=UPI000A48B415|nr:hypothetical protein [Bifidobacterium breve]